MSEFPAPKVSLILPAYNERARIIETLVECRDYFIARGLAYEIIVSADGNDGTREVVREWADGKYPVYVLGDIERRGKGRGVRLAVERARGQYMGYMDADNKTPISELDKFLPILDEGAPIVIGSRASDEARIENPAPLYRRLGSLGFRYAMWGITGLIGIRDTQCGFKFFAQDAARELFRRQKVDSYMFDVEILCLAKKLGMPIRQVPVRWRADGDSRLNLVRGNIQNLKDLLRIRRSLC